MSVDLSILDLAQVGTGETVGESFAASLDMAQRAEKWGYRRIWYAEHHNMGSIASAATSVLIAHVAAHTERITLGSGGVMLPNHSPLQIAEQFGTLAELHPGRIELGLGRAPGTDQVTLRALRRKLKSPHPDIEAGARLDIRQKTIALERRAEHHLMQALEHLPREAAPGPDTLQSLVAVTRVWSPVTPRKELQTLTACLSA